ncbi:MAG: ABC transporter substrate-binding protein [SAR324 cluster bacterium]|nr:ABC transporter substrate-binding protein [SAR324 cluster bacterium]
MKMRGWAASLRRYARVAVLAVLLTGAPLLPVDAQGAPDGRIVNIAAFTTSWGPTPHVVGLRDGLVELGYRENQDFAIGVRFTQGKINDLDNVARELVQSGADIIFTTNSHTAKAAQRATSRIPIIFTGAIDPVGTGLIKSFARPGGNLTGFTDLELDLGPKRLEMFRKLVPGMEKVLFIYYGDSPNARNKAGKYRQAARRLGIELIERLVRSEQEARTILFGPRAVKVDGILSDVQSGLNMLGLLLEATTQHKIPTMFSSPFMVEQGGFSGYGPSWYEAGRQAARIADKIIKGQNPAEIPVEVNTRIVFAVNLKVAKSLGLIIPPQVLYMADRIVR